MTNTAAKNVFIGKDNGVHDYFFAEAVDENGGTVFIKLCAPGLGSAGHTIKHYAHTMNLKVLRIW
jgi:hypothetical protein